MYRINSGQKGVGKGPRGRRGRHNEWEVKDSQKMQGSKGIQSQLVFKTLKWRDDILHWAVAFLCVGDVQK